VLQGKKPLFIVLSQERFQFFVLKKAGFRFQGCPQRKEAKLFPMDGWMDALPNLASHCATATTTGTMEPKGGEHHVTH
jgi:hypothetical protein